MDASGFKPIIDERSNPQVLILGSIPGVRSLKESVYYAHPQNSFWWIMSEIFEFDVALNYDKRSSLLTQNGVALWDVIQSCFRPGSLDSSIEPDSIVANDFESLLSIYPSIRCIAFNGQAARKTFKKHVEKNQKIDGAIKLITLPSTSPAYAAMTREQKLSKWREIIPS